MNQGDKVTLAELREELIRSNEETRAKEAANPGSGVAILMDWENAPDYMFEQIAERNSLTLVGYYVTEDGDVDEDRVVDNDGNVFRR